MLVITDVVGHGSMADRQTKTETPKDTQRYTDIQTLVADCSVIVRTLDISSSQATFGSAFATIAERRTKLTYNSDHDFNRVFVSAYNRAPTTSLCDLCRLSRANFHQLSHLLQ